MEAVLSWLVIVCLGYLAVVYASYVALIAVGWVENAVRRHELRAEDLESIATSRFTIPVSVVVAAYNEESAIVPTVRSLLALDYPEHQVIVVNDGSTDATLEAVRSAFGLEPFEVFVRKVYESADVRAVYRSVEHPNLLVVDKENGGKSDALNAGLNLARYRYVCGVDADTILSRDALLKGMRLVMTDPARIVGVTSHLTIAHDPEVTMAEPVGRRRIAARPLIAFQHLDYLRAFFNNRLGWSRLDFMLCAVGAFQIWRRDVLEEVGGFARGFTCEDIELTFRIHERFLREGRDYRIVCLPDNVGATEGPDTPGKLVAQRERWQRVIAETVWHYRRMLFNPRYRRVGLLGVPFYLVSEVLAPVFEVLAVVSLALAACLGAIDWGAFVAFVAAIAFVNGAITAAAVLADDLQSRAYRLRDLVRVLLLAPLDLVLYRPLIGWSRLQGTWRFLRGDKGWHKFERNARASR
jgi:poly-beta-1,6-N-acetyl-D-glucosamine synthase